MPKVQTITTNFTAGVFDPKLRGRVDLEKYNASLKDGEDIVILRQGGATARPPLDYLGEVAVNSVDSRLVPFVYSNDESYVLEFSVPSIRFWKDGEAITTSPGVPYTVTNPYNQDQLHEFDFVQSGDTLLMAHPTGPIKRLRRFSDTNWAVDDAPVDPAPIAEIGARADIAITLSAATIGSGRTATAGSDFFRQADVGRTFSCQGGTATVTGYTSTTVVTIDITADFPSTALAGNTWLLQGSPLVELTPSAKDPVGASISLTGTATAFRSTDTGAYVSINGGLVRLTSVDGVAADSDTHNGDGANDTFAYTFQILTSSEIVVTVGGVVQTLFNGLGGDYTLTGVGSPSGGNVVFEAGSIPAAGVGNVVFTRSTGAPSIGSGVIVQELTSTTAAPSDAWVLKHPIWNAVDGYPSALTLHEQRLWAGNTTRYPQSLWGSRSGLFFDFLPGPNDDDAVYKTVDSPQANPIRYLHSSRTMVALTDASEIEVRGGVEKPITQSNASIKKQSKRGCTTVKPEEAGDNLVFVQRGGKVLRAIFPLDVDGFTAKNISIYSEHLLGARVRGLTFQQTPESVLWAWLEDGTFVAITFDVENNVIALAPCSTDGRIESMCTVPEGDQDVTYATVNRTINGFTKRYIERLNWSANPGMDSRKSGAAAGTYAWTGFAHLAGKTVAVLADGIAAGTAVVDGSGGITIEVEASNLLAGLVYEPRVVLQAPEVGTGTGTAQGQAMSIHRVVVRFFETYGCRVRVGDGSEPTLAPDQDLDFETMGDDPLDGEAPAFTGDVDISDYGWARDGTNTLQLYQPLPYPWTVLAVIRELTVNPG